MKALVSEKDVQRTIVEGLRVLGYEVLEISRKFPVECCPACGTRFRASKWGGGDRGIPDLFVSRTTWPVGAWLGLEVKGPTTRVSVDQIRLREGDRIVIVRSWEAALKAIEEFRREVGDA